MKLLNEILARLASTLFLSMRIEPSHNLLKIAGNVGWLFFDKILRMSIGLCVIAWMARYLGPDQFGLIGYATSLIGLFSCLATLGLKDIVIRNIIQDPSAKNEILGTAAFLELIGGVVAYTLVVCVINWFRPDDASAKIIVAILGFSFLFKFCDIAAYWFESQLLSKYVVWVQSGSFLIFASVKALLILQGAPLTAFAWATLAEAFAVALLMMGMLIWHKSKPLALKVSFAKIQELLNDSWPLMLSGVAIMIYMKIDQIMLAQMVNDREAGIYNAATRISEVWYFIPTMIVASVFPSILEAKKQSQYLYHARLQSLYNLMVWISIAVVVPVTFFATPIVTYLFGDSYAKSGLVLAIHIWASIFVFIGVASSSWFVAENKSILDLKRTLLGAVVNILLNYLMIPSLGAVGAALATVVSYSVATLFADAVTKETRKMFKMKLNAINIFNAYKKLE